MRVLLTQTIGLSERLDESDVEEDEQQPWNEDADDGLCPEEDPALASGVAEGTEIDQDKGGGGSVGRGGGGGHVRDRSKGEQVEGGDVGDSAEDVSECDG